MAENSSVSELVDFKLYRGLVSKIKNKNKYKTLTYSSPDVYIYHYILWLMPYLGVSFEYPNECPLEET